MPQTWLAAYNAYSYPADLSVFGGAHQFQPNHFNRQVAVDRQSTIDFEDNFRVSSENEIIVYYEVLFWKMFNMGMARDNLTNQVINEHQELLLISRNLNNFIENDNYEEIANMEYLRTSIGIKSGLAVTLTFPAFMNPERFPMVDIWVARWVNENIEIINANPNNAVQLLGFEGYQNQVTAQELARQEGRRGTTPRLKDDDYFAYVAWVKWCRMFANRLTELNGQNDVPCRARDVEMAVFVSQRDNLILNLDF